MKVKNITARGIWVGDVLIAPNAIETIGAEWADAINKDALQEVKEPVKQGRKSKETESDTIESDKDAE